MAAARALLFRAGMTDHRTPQAVLPELDAAALERVAGGVAEPQPPPGGYTVTPPVGSPYTVIRDVNQLLSLRRWDAQFGRK